MRPPYTDPSRKDWVTGFLLIIIFILLISVTAVLLLPDDWLIWLAIVIVGMLTLVSWHTRRFAFRCRECGHEFEINFITNLIAPHGIDQHGAWEYLKCPECQKRHKADVLKK